MSRRKLGIAAAVAVVTATLFTCAMVANPFVHDDRTATQRQARATSSVSVAPTPTASAQDPIPGTPNQIVIPALGVDSAVVPLESEDRVLDAPGDPAVIGWWSQGAKPGAAEGAALLTGHSVHTGEGALIDLETLAEGDQITVRTDEGRIEYAVEDVRVLDTAELAEQAEDLFDQTTRARIVVITCEDWDGSQWNSNVVVTALPTAA